VFLLALGVAAATTATAQTVLLSDNFEVNSSANYTVVNDGTPNGTQTFAFDYVAAGIPAAPRSLPGDLGGLRLTANDSLGATDAWSVFHNTVVNAPRYTMRVDAWMNFAAPSGSTEFGHVGVGGNGTTFNSVFSPISGSGAFIAFTGDGGSGSDYRWFRDPANTPPGDAANTTLPNSHPSYLGHGSNNTGAFFQSLFPSPPSTIAGSPGNIWTTIEIQVDNVLGIISFSFDGTLVFQGFFANTFSGLVSLGIADTFTSVSGASNVFTLYDNLEVVTPAAVGTVYCSPAVVNSSGMAASITATGSDVVALNSLSLTVTGLPMQTFVLGLGSPTQGFWMNPGGSAGNLCLGGSIGRGVGRQIYATSNGQVADIAVDLTNLPTPILYGVPALPGETWNFQAWFRDPAGVGSAASNFTDAVAITYQ